MNITHSMCFFCHKYRQITIFCLILFVFMAEGRSISNLNKVTKNGMEEINNGKTLVEKFQIGSRPPKCERRCRNCVHCEAVQVPIVPSHVQIHRIHYYYSPDFSRGDGLSNYKPISWMCKCGDYFFNP